MRYVVGLVIALFIALTGVGAGRTGAITNPPPQCRLAHAGIQASLRSAGSLVGSLFLNHLVSPESANLLNVLLCMILLGTAGSQLVFTLCPVKQDRETRNRNSLLSWLMFGLAANSAYPLLSEPVP